MKIITMFGDSGSGKSTFADLASQGVYTGDLPQGATPAPSVHSIHDVHSNLSANKLVFALQALPPGFVVFDDANGDMLLQVQELAAQVNRSDLTAVVILGGQDALILAGLRAFQKKAYEASKAAGWWTDENGRSILENPLTVSNKTALIHTEVAEMTEADRKDKMDSHLPHRKGIEVEAADVLVRTVDLIGALGLDVGAAVLEKMDYNLHREDHKAEVRAKADGKRY